MRSIKELAKTEIGVILERKTTTEKGTNVLRIPEAIDKITSLSLTTAGKVDLSCFPEEAIKAADTALNWAKGKKEVRAPFKYFCKVAYRYSEEKGIPLNYTLRDELRIEHKVKDDDPKESGASYSQTRTDQPQFS